MVASRVAKQRSWQQRSGGGVGGCSCAVSPTDTISIRTAIDSGSGHHDDRLMRESNTSAPDDSHQPGRDCMPAADGLPGGDDGDDDDGDAEK